MFFISDKKTTAPVEFKTPLQKATYKALEELHILFERVDTDEAITMDDCVLIDQKLDVRIVKTLFLCNRKQTDFYLFVTTADKSFKSKEFSSAMGVPRVSFAPSFLLEEMMGTKVGAATIFSVLMDEKNKVSVVMDKDVVEEEWYGCSDSTTTGYMKIRTSDILHKFLAYSEHEPTVIQI